jgi:hypothetical protein
MRKKSTVESKDEMNLNNLTRSIRITSAMEFGEQTDPNDLHTMTNFRATSTPTMSWSGDPDDFYLSAISPTEEPTFLEYLINRQPFIEFFDARKSNRSDFAEYKELYDYLLIFMLIALLEGNRTVYTKIYFKEPNLHKKIGLRFEYDSLKRNPDVFGELVQKLLNYSEFKIFKLLFLRMGLSKEETKILVQTITNSSKLSSVSALLRSLSPEEVHIKFEFTAAVINHTEEAVALKFYKDVSAHFKEGELITLMRNLQERKIIAIYNRNPFIITEQFFQLFIDKKYYEFILRLNKQMIFDNLMVAARFRKILSDFQKAVKPDYILQIVYKAKELLSYDENLKQFYRSALKIFETESTKSALFFSQNPLNFALKIGILLKRFNRRQKLKNEDYKRLALKFIHLAENLTRVSNEEIIKSWIFSTDYLGKNFLDYCFKIYSEELIAFRYTQYAIETYWHHNVQSKKMVLSYFHNTINYCKNFLKERKGRQRSSKIFEPEVTHSLFKFSIYRRSLLYRVFNQLINLGIVFGFEVTIIYLFDAVRYDSSVDSNAKIFVCLMEQFPVISIIVWILRFSFLIQTFGQTLIFKGRKEKIGIYRLDIVTLLCLLVVCLIFFCAPISAGEGQGGFLLIFLKDSFCYLLAVKIFYLLLPTPYLGKSIRIYTQLLSQLIRFLLISAFFFSILALLLHNIYMLWNSKYNGYTNVFEGWMTSYVYTFGSVVFDISKVDGYYVTMNIILIMVSFFGNFLLFNIMTTVFSSRFKKIYDRAFYLTSKSQYEFFTVFPHSDYDAFYYIPFCSHPILTLIFALALQGKKSLAKINYALKIVSHVIFVCVIFFTFLIVVLLILTIVRFLGMFYEIAVSANSVRQKIFLEVRWLVCGLGYVGYAAGVDFTNSARVICDYSLTESATQTENPKRFAAKSVRFFDTRNFYKHTKEINKMVSKEIRSKYAEYFYVTFKMHDVLQDDHQKKPLNRSCVLGSFRATSTEEKQPNSSLKYLKSINFSKTPMIELKKILSMFVMAHRKINFKFIERYLKENRQVNLHKLRFMFSEIEHAMFLTIYDEEKDIQTSLQQIDEKIEALGKTVRSFIKKS